MSNSISLKTRVVAAGLLPALLIVLMAISSVLGIQADILVPATAAACLLVLAVNGLFLLRTVITPLGAEPDQIRRLMLLLQTGDIESDPNPDKLELLGLFGGLVEIQNMLRQGQNNPANAEPAGDEYNKLVSQMQELEEQRVLQLEQYEQKTIEKENECKRTMEVRVNELLEVVQAACTGDLTREATANSDDLIGKVGRGLEVLRNTLHDNVEELKNQSCTFREASDELSLVNVKMRESVSKTADQARQACTSVEEISINVDSVATAVVEMSSSIREIARNSSEAVDVAEQAVLLATNTDSSVRQLSESSNGIGAVIKVINSIAEQTNLLALNATIEAARAGDAGKGFAVVANEVKELAKETAKATDEIEQKISTIQSDSANAVNAIGDISSIVGRISGIQSAIATAVQQQSSTTEDISRSIAEVSQGTTEIARNVAEVSGTATQNLECMDRSKQAVDALSGMSSKLNDLVAQYRLGSPLQMKSAA
jgi:methyl-accepting chemotaxis protein